jgi:hypothetical protein
VKKRDQEIAGPPLRVEHIGYLSGIKATRGRLRMPCTKYTIAIAIVSGNISTPNS